MSIFVSFLAGFFQTPAMAGFAPPPPPPPQNDKIVMAGLVIGAIAVAIFLSGCHEA